MPIPDEERSINEPHAKTIYARTPQAGGPDQIADTTVIYFDTVYIFDIFDIDDVHRIDDINAAEQAESAYQDARHYQRTSAIRISEAVGGKADASTASGADFSRRLH